MALGRFLRILAVACLAAVPGVSTGQSFEQLLKATNEGDTQTVAGYLRQGLDPDSADSIGNTLLMIAARLGHQDLVKLLISRKASVTRRNPYGDTALMFASLKGHLEVVKLLVANGARISHEGWAPLHYAAFEGRAEVVKYLIEKGADKNAYAPNGYTPLMLAAHGDHLEAAKTLLYDDADLTIRGPKGETALSIAKAGKFEELEGLLRRAGAVD